MRTVINADIVGRSWKRIWRMACSVYALYSAEAGVSISGKRRPQSKGSESQTSASSSTLSKEQRRDRNVLNGICLHCTTELFQDIIVNWQPTLHSLHYRQEHFLGYLLIEFKPSPEVLKWLRTLLRILVHHNGQSTVCSLKSQY